MNEASPIKENQFSRHKHVTISCYDDQMTPQRTSSAQFLQERPVFNGLQQPTSYATNKPIDLF